MFVLRLAWRDFTGSKLLWALSAAAVALGVATIVSADVVRGAVLNAMQNSPDMQTIMGGLTDLLGSNLTTMGAAISFASGFVVFNAFGMLLARRRIRIATLRTAGMTRSQLLRLTMAEAVLSGLLGVALGLAAGPALGGLVIAGLKAVTTEGRLVFEAGPPSLPAMVLAAALGLLVSVGAALAPALAASRVSPLAGRRLQTNAASERTAGPLAGIGLFGLLALLLYFRLAPPAAWLRPPWDTRAALLAAALWLGLTLALAPGLATWIGRTLRRPLRAAFGASGVLMADNLHRDRGRVTLTIASLTVSLALVVSVMGFTHFSGESLMGPKLQQAAALGAWNVTSFDVTGGMAGYGDLSSLTMDPADVQAVRRTVGGQAEVAEFGFAVVPELSYFGQSYFSFVVDPGEVRSAGEWLFSFNKGSWDQALAAMEAGCGALVMPPIALQLQADVGDPIRLNGPAGPVDCTLAGVGAAFGAASIVGTPDRASFNAERPFTLLVQPLPGVDRSLIDQELSQLASTNDGLSVVTMASMVGYQQEMIDQVPTVLDAMAVLALLAAALGVVNTLTVGVLERRRELGLYRAVGATRRQLMEVVSGEAALMATVGGGLGLLGGIGITIVIATVYGGASWGLPNMDHWAEAANALRPAIALGLVGWASTPLIGALAGLLPARVLLRRRSLVEELLAERH